MARMTLDQIWASGGRVDRARLDATTDADIAGQAREDGTDTPLGPHEVYPTPATVRRHLGLTQTAIADLVGVPVATWRNWEQGRVTLDPAVRTLLRVLWREPDAFKRAMAAA
ncbi:helix-turn-helix domain-containing protein [Nguyenibacter vanlangensis]|uniref:Helix-turn-helix domain-containing protein n=1 Tax=Nguyenibacter vanlangensis TaxID=1216886 RepID=A0ABZ3D0T0_9PROT